MDSVLVIMAAGIGSRFGSGIKQLTPVGPNGERIIDYSIYDALAAGFTKVVFIIRPELEAQMREEVGDRIASIIGTENVSYAFQTLTALPAGFDAEALSAGRKKPWGTGQAVLSCKGVVNAPFCVINADDYYGKHAFQIVNRFLKTHDKNQREYCMAGFVLKNTLSDFGSVTRGVCTVESSQLKNVVETHDILKTKNGAEANGCAIDPECIVSMNMWGFTPDFLEFLEADFSEFLRTGDLAKGEYLLPSVVGEHLKKGEITVECTTTNDSWFGVTYQDDKPIVEREIRKLIDKGEYPEKLWK